MTGLGSLADKLPRTALIAGVFWRRMRLSFFSRHALIRWTLLGLTLAIASRSAVAYDPYQSRQDREYRSLAEATKRAYSVPPSNYKAPAYSSSTPAYSSSSTARSGSSYSSPANNAGQPFVYESLAQIESRLADSKRAQAEAAAARAAAARTQALLDEAMWERIHRANARADQEQLRRREVYSVRDWEKLTRETGGRLPARSPTNGEQESRQAEFEHVSTWARLEGKARPWENLRAAVMCLRYQGNDATPDRAWGFFSQSNPDWPEVQLGLGLCLLRGYGVAPDPVRAVALLEKAAETSKAPENPPAYPGHDLPTTTGYEACRELAIAYDLGRGLPADPVLALTWYQRAGKYWLFVGEDAELKDLKNAFWQKHESDSVALLQAELVANANRAATNQSTVVEDSLLEFLKAQQADQKLYEVGLLLDQHGRRSTAYYLAAAEMGHDAAARAFFSPPQHGDVESDLDGRSYWAKRAEYVSKNWPDLEARWQKAVADGDRAAGVPLAFYYSGIRGNRPSRELAERYLALLPADVPAPQRAAIERGIRLLDIRANRAWEESVWAAFHAKVGMIDLNALTVAPNPAQAKIWRDEGNRLAGSDPLKARDLWRDAAALGDLLAQVRLYTYTRSFGMNLESAYEDSLRLRLKSAAAHDPGAMIALFALFGAPSSNPLSPAKARYETIAATPATSDREYADALAAARIETETWLATAADWGLEGRKIVAQVTLSPDVFDRNTARRVQFKAFAAAAEAIERQLPLWENSLDPIAFNPASDAHFLLGYAAWLGSYDNDAPPRDPVLALSYLTQSTSQGHPLAPLALAYFFGSGWKGFPQNAAIAKRLHDVADLRLTVMAANGDHWAQTFLGDLLVTGNNRRDYDPERAAAFEWLPRDDARGLRWLKAAALDGATLPANFADSTGQLVSWYISQYYYNAGDKPNHDRWELITKLFQPFVFYTELTPAEWADAVEEARAILADPPASARLAELDQEAIAAEQAYPEDNARLLKAFTARAEARFALGWKRSASFDAETAVLSAPTSPAPWQLLTRIQQNLKEPRRAAISTAIARTVAADAAGPAALERAMAAASSREVMDVLGLFGKITYAQPVPPVLLDLAERAEKFRAAAEAAL